MRRNSHAASCKCSAELVRTWRSAAEVGRRPAGLSFARSCTISDENFCGTEKNSEKISVRKSIENATKTAGRVVPVLCRPCEDPSECGGGRAPSGRADFCAISHDFGSKFLRHRKRIRNFSVRNWMENATQTAGRVVPVLSRPCEDLQECRGG